MSRVRNRRWWVSWYEPAEDYRPLAWPLPPEVPHYWCSGHGARGAVLCAIVDAPSAEKAQGKVSSLWGNAHPDWRFCEARDDGWMPEPSRFPVRRE